MRPCIVSRRSVNLPIASNHSDRLCFRSNVFQCNSLRSCSRCSSQKSFHKLQNRILHQCKIIMPKKSLCSCVDQLKFIKSIQRSIHFISCCFRPIFTNLRVTEYDKLRCGMICFNQDANKCCIVSSPLTANSYTVSCKESYQYTM